MFSVKLTGRSKKQLDSLPQSVQLQIAACLDVLRENARPPGSKKLKGHSAWSLRTGDYRVIYHQPGSELVILVIKIGDRKDVYRGI